MTPLVIALVGFSVGLAAVHLRRPMVRLPIDRDRRGPASAGSRLGPLEHIGRLGARLMRRPFEGPRDRAIGRRVVIVVVAALVHPLLGPVTALAWWGASVRERRRRSRMQDDELADAMADVIDLCAVALLSGKNVGGALHHVARWSDGAAGEALRRCTRRVGQGRAVDESLRDLARELGAPARPLVAALLASERHGAPIIENLRRLADDSRADRRRRAEAAARRLPVVLLFPLVVCVLPAFLLVTVVPVVFDTFAAFDLTATD